MKRVAVVAALAAAGLALAGCGGSGTKNTAAGGKKLLGIVSITATDAGNARVIRGAKKVAEAAGWTVEVVDAQGSADTANAAIRNFVSKKATAIFDLVFPTSSLGAGLAAAKQANIPVATWGGGLGTGVVMTTGDGGPFAKPAVDRLLADMGESGSVLALTYRTGQVCRDRENIYDGIVKSHPGIKTTKNEVHIPGFLQDGQQYANAWLSSHSKGSSKLAIWGCWEDPTLGAIAALKQRNRTDVLTYGINGGPQAIKAVQDGSLTATVYEDGIQEGETMFNVTLEAMKAGSAWRPKTVDVPGILVDKSTSDQFVKDHPEALG